MKEEKEIIIPTLEEFERVLFAISEKATLTVLELYEEEKAKGNVDETGKLKDDCSIGSTIMYLKKRSALYKWFNSIPTASSKLYSIFVYDDSVSISIHSLTNNQSYTVSRAAYEIIADGLREEYGWDIFNNVNID